MYYLGIDVGTTWTAAATWQAGRAQMVTLGSHSAAVPSVVAVRSDGELLVGEAAERRAVTDPGRVAREFKRRIGDPTPLVLGGRAYRAEELTAEVLRAVVHAAAQVEGGPPERTVVTHPASWGSYKLELLDRAVGLAGLASVEFVAEPEAAAVYYASTERVTPGQLVAVYDFGGGTFDAAVLRNNGSRFERLGEPSGVERLGGIDFDAAIFEFVRLALGGAIEALDPEDDAAMAAAARLREECVDAKEALSSDVETSIPVLLPGLNTEVRLGRVEFEDLIRPSVLSTVEALRRAVRSAGVEPSQLSRVLLVGGSSRIPLVAQMVASELGCPVNVDAHPKHAIALGASIAASAGATDTGTAAVAAGTQVVHVPPAGLAAGAVPTGPAGEVSGPAPATPLPPIPPPAAPPLAGPPPMGPVTPLAAAAWGVAAGPPPDLGDPLTVPVRDDPTHPDRVRTGELPAIEDPTAAPWGAAPFGAVPPPTASMPAAPPVGPGLPGSPVAASAGEPPAPSAGRRTGILVALALLLVVVLGGTAVALESRGGDGDQAASTKSDQSDRSSADRSDQSSADSSSDRSDKTTTTTAKPTTTTAKPLGPPGPVPVSFATATSSAPPSVDGGGNAVTYDPANVLDGADDTCWRVAGDGSGQQLTFTLGQETNLTKVGLLPGYDKIDSFDGTDRWLEERRPTSVRWTFDDGTTVDQPLQDTRSLQSIGVNTTTKTVQLEILGSTPPGTRDFVAISEVAFEGRQ